MCNTTEPVTDLKSFFARLPDLSDEKEIRYYYRGQADEAFDLKPSILRGDNQKHEHDAYVKAITECPDEFPHGMSHIDILTKMQHYGVPTRLLDITSNPLVALYFACEQHGAKEGVVYCLCVGSEEDRKKLYPEELSLTPDMCNFLCGEPKYYPVKQYDSDVIAILSCFPCLTCEELSQLHCQAVLAEEEFNDQEIAKKLLSEIQKERPYFSPHINIADIMHNCYYIPQKNNPRLIRQNGAFIIFGLQDPPIVVNSPDAKSRSSSYRIVIDHSAKDEIRKELELFGVSKKALFPELYEVAKALKEEYGLV